MSLYGAFDQTKHLDELDDALVTQEGVLSAATRRLRVLRNISGEAGITLAQLNVLSGVTPGTVAASKAVVADADGAVEFAFSYAAAGSHQIVAVDLTLGALAGTSTSGDSDFLAPIMGNLLDSAALTRTNNYLGGLIGHYSATSGSSTVYPEGAVLGGIGDGVSDTHVNAFTAYIDGDSAQTIAGAAFKVMHNNSTAGSGFNFGLDLFDAAHSGFNAVSFIDADIRLNNERRLYSGTAVTRAAVRAEVGDTAPIGSIYVGNAAVATTKPNLYVKTANGPADTDWERVVTAATD